MRTISLAFVLVIVLATPALAGGGCATMMMPAISLKQVSRGFGPIGPHGFHSGLDLTAPYGSAVRAALGGEVAFIGSYFGYGNIVDLRHGDGMTTRYAHLSAFAPGLRVGQRVATGALLGAVGTSGHAHGPHLHFEVRIDGQAVDPKPFLALAPCRAAPEAIEEAQAPAAEPAVGPGHH